MRFISLLLTGTVLTAATAAHAADQLKFDKAPTWVVPQSIPAVSEKAKDRPIALLLHDQQTLLEPGKISTYSELAYKIQKPEGLSAGNLSVSWNPATDTVTVNKLEIRRANQIIDVLKSGQTFTTMRRESNLELATLDGVLTGNIQPEGLQEGDVIVLATTTEHVDPVLKNHVEAVFAPWGSSQIGLAHARLAWPLNLDVKVRNTGDLPASQPSSAGSRKAYELTMRDVNPVIMPKSAPVRFNLGRMGVATDFGSWADAAQLMAPLYRDAAVIPAAGSLRDEVKKIAAASTDPKTRAEGALQLVQQRVRYVALLMGQGGYVPAPAEATWSRRFGDCKAKTALLLAILHDLGIRAEPVLVNPILGDAIADQLPMIGLFNHVLVRAHIGAKDYWLDGTRNGDTDLDAIDVPDFGWGLPLMDNAQLVHLVPPLRDVPNAEHRVNVDASAGVFAPAPVTIEEVYRGDSAVEMNAAYSALSSDQRDEQMRDKARGYFDTFTAGSSSVQFDKVKRELDIKIQGTARLNWKDGWLYVPTSSIGFDPDFDRPAGSLHDVPIAVNHPRFAKDVATLKLPAGLASQQKLDPAVHETLAGVEYARSEAVNGDLLTVESSERSIAPEVPYKEALAAVPRLRTLNKDDVYLRLPSQYRPTDRDLAALNEQTPQSANEYFIRAGARLAHNQKDEALADLNAGLALDPTSIWGLNARADTLIEKQRFDEAEKDLTAGLAIEPADAYLLATRGILAQRKGDAADAMQYFTKALQADSKNYKARLGRAWAYDMKHEMDAAIADLNALLAQYPKDALVLATRAMMYANKQDKVSAAKDIAAVRAIDPKNPLLLVAQAQLARANHDLTGVIDAQSKLIEAKSDAGASYASRAQAYYDSGKYDLALKDTEQALALGYKSPDVRVLRANIFMKGKRDAVAAEADAMTRENPASDFAFVAAGKTYAALGQNEKAMRAFDRALAIKPYAYVYINRAQIRPKSDVAGRMADLDAALKLEPDDPDALAEKARLLTRSGDYKGALAILDRMKPDPNNSYAALQRAIVLYKAGRTDEAQKILATARANSKSPAELNSLCWTKATADLMLDSALQDCREALKLSPDNGPYLDSLGMALLRLGKLDEALAAYNRAVAKNTGAASLMGRAFVYLRKGDASHAQADAAAARKLYPDIDAQFAEYGLSFDTKAAAQVAK
jgi:tetratricopeptide (TPR) repeat protein/transglutaminase-like putative cysteine protease